MATTESDPYRRFGDHVFLRTVEALDLASLVTASRVRKTWAALIHAAVDWRQRYLDSDADPLEKQRWEAKDQGGQAVNWRHVGSSTARAGQR